MFKLAARFTLLTLVSVGWGAERQVPLFELVGSDTVELGNLFCFEPQTALFRLKNVGEARGAILRLIPTCSCLSGTADKVWVLPKEEATIRLALDPAALHGAFRRVLWVETNDPASPRFALTLRGQALPLFHGLPDSPQQVALPEGASWTNRFSLTQAVTNLFLGAPALDTDTNALRATARLVTNRTSEKTTFDLTLTATPVVPGRHTLTLKVPVEGRPGLPPLKLVYHFQAGLSLQAVPSRILLAPAEQPVTVLLHVMAADKQVLTTDKNLAPEALTWSPRHEGVSVQIARDPKYSFLQAQVTLSPEAIARLLKEKEPRLTFHYPNFKPFSVLFVARPERPAAPQASRP